MATAIKVKYCRHCGQLESMHSMMDIDRDINVIRVWCSCGAQEPRVTELAMHEPYYLDVEVRTAKGESSDDDSDSGSVPAGGEARAEGDA